MDLRTPVIDSRLASYGIGLGLLALSIVPQRAQAAPVRYDQDRVLRVQPANEAELHRLLEIADDVWTERPGPGRPVDVRVSPSSQEVLDAEGFDYEVRISDVQRAVDQERERIHRASSPSAAPSDWFSEFRDLDEINDYIDQLVAMRPDLVSVESVGMSIENREIRAMHFNSPTTTGKSGMLLTGTQHAREWLSPMTTMCIAEALVMGYEQDAEFTSLLDELEFIVVPVTNPDGYAYSWTDERYWRKNRRDNHGVDLNRNWDYEWGVSGSSSNPNAEDYRGESPHSEPEVIALVNYIEARDHLIAHVDFHSYGSLILYPWSYTSSSAPDKAILKELAENMSEASEASEGHFYDPIQSAGLYPAAGVIDDWTYAARDMKSYTIELRGNDFVVPPSQINPACEENLAAVLALAEWAREQSDPVPVDPGSDTGSESGASSGGEDDDTGAGNEGGPGNDDNADDGDLPGGTGSNGGGAATTNGQPPGGGPASEATGTQPPAMGDSDGDEEGCGCSQGRTRPDGTAWMLMVLGLGWVRRRHRAAQ